MSGASILHVVLFLGVAAVIVAIGCMFAEADDKRALAIFPRRFGLFVFWSAVVTALMLVAEHTLASVS